MASGGYSQNYKLVDNETVLKESLRELKSLNRNTRFAVDCEGVDLSRKGELTIVTVATEVKAYIFDVTVLKQAVFNEGLREILEDKTREKLVFDCRQDSDSLWHQFRVKLSGVLDVQLLEVLYRCRSYVSSTSWSRQTRRSERINDVENIRGFGHCLELYVKDQHAIKSKDDGKSLFQRDKTVWKRRPLSATLLRYCAVDTIQLFQLYRKLQRPAVLPRLRIASERYADMYRGKSVRRYDKYESNGFLPLDIIPDEGVEAVADTTCNGCQRIFPRDEFRATQFGERKCRLCRKIDQKTGHQTRQTSYSSRGRSTYHSNFGGYRSRYYDDDDDDDYYNDYRDYDFDDYY